MAEHNKIQLFSNYDSLTKVKSKNIQDHGDFNTNPTLAANSRITRVNRNHAYEKLTTSRRKCQKSQCSNSHCTRTSTSTRKLLIAHENHETTTNLSQLSLITNHQSKCVVMKNSHDDDKLFDDSIDHKRLGSALGRTRGYFSCYYKIKPLTIALLLAIGILLRVNFSCGFTLDGTQNSFAQFRKWYSGLNGTLELEFKTEQPNGLLLYTDDGGTYDFFELKLVEGVLRLRYNLGGGAQIITVGRDLHDGHWHKVQVS